MRLLEFGIYDVGAMLYGSADVFAHGGPAVVYVLTRAVFRELLASGAPEGAALLAGIGLVLTRRLEEAIKKAATFRILAGPI